MAQVARHRNDPIRDAAAPLRTGRDAVVAATVTATSRHGVDDGRVAAGVDDADTSGAHCGMWRMVWAGGSDVGLGGGIDIGG